MSYDKKTILDAAKKAGINLIENNSNNNIIYPDGTEEYIDVRIKNNVTTDCNYVINDLTAQSDNLFINNDEYEVIYDTKDSGDYGLDLKEFLNPTHDLSSLQIDSNIEVNHLNKSNNDFERAA